MKIDSQTYSSGLGWGGVVIIFIAFFLLFWFTCELCGCSEPCSGCSTSDNYQLLYTITFWIAFALAVAAGYLFGRSHEQKIQLSSKSISKPSVDIGISQNSKYFPDTNNYNYGTLDNNNLMISNNQISDSGNLPNVYFPDISEY